MDRLPTKQRLVKFMQIDPSCELCSAAESRGHLFFECPYSAKGWKDVCAAIGKTGVVFNTWDQTISWALSALKRNTAVNLVMKLGISATIYHIWLERNKRLHHGLPSFPSALTMIILQTLRDRISGVPRLKRKLSETDFPFSPSPSWVGIWWWPEPSCLEAVLGLLPDPSPGIDPLAHCWCLSLSGPSVAMMTSSEPLLISTEPLMPLHCLVLWCSVNLKVAVGFYWPFKNWLYWWWWFCSEP